MIDFDDVSFSYDSAESAAASRRSGALIGRQGLRRCVRSQGTPPRPAGAGSQGPQERPAR